MTKFMDTHTTKPGRFITFEGGEGAGKSTQSKALLDYLNNHNIPCILTREPGGTPNAESIRTLLVEGSVDKWSTKTELLLHLAARMEHVTRTIEPALKEGTWVLCDRFFDSTYAYQAYGHQLGKAYVQQLHHLLFGTLQPDLTFMFDITPSKGLERTTSREHDENRYEKMDQSFHTRVYEGYLDIARTHPHRCKIIDATASIDDIKERIVGYVNTAFNL